MSRKTQLKRPDFQNTKPWPRSAISNILFTPGFLCFMMIFYKNGRKSFFCPKKEHFSFKSVISMIWEIFWCILLVCRTKIGDFEKSSHNSPTRDPWQPWGCSWGHYATQGADQGLKLKLGTLSNWGIWVLEDLTFHSSDTRGVPHGTPPADHHLKKAQP